MIRVALVENEPMLSEAVSQLLHHSAGAICVGVCANGEDALLEIVAWQPDVVLMDIDLGAGINGIETIARLYSLCPKTRFLVLTIFEDSQHVFEAIAAGAMGYVLKSASPDYLLTAITDVHEGGSPITPSIARQLLQRFRELPDVGAPTKTEAILTKREVEIIELIAKGKMEKEVATELFISFKTVKTHISNIYQKLQVNTRIEALNKYFGTYS